MKRFTKEDLEKYIQREVERICIAENLITKPEPVNPIPASAPIEFESSKKETVSEAENIKIEDVKMLAEELTRMKSLIDFRSPLLKRD